MKQEIDTQKAPVKKNANKKRKSRFFTTLWTMIFLLFIAVCVLVFMAYSMMMQGEKEVYHSPADEVGEAVPVSIITPNQNTQDVPLAPLATESQNNGDIETLKPIESIALEAPADIENTGKPLDPTNQDKHNFDNLF